jgi:all-trans-8'-apo-beta-carotenal 15,15'-oxygenase
MQTASSTPTYDHRDWEKGNLALKDEYDYPIEDIEGEIPHQLQGTLFRNIPAMLDVNGRELKHPFDADGMICAFTFNNGQAHFRNRYVRTEGFVKEQEAGEICYRRVFGTPKPGGWLNNAFDFDLKDVANTNVICWGDRLLAFWEATNPHVLDPHTLETIGKETFGGVLEGGKAFTAHPMIDPGGDGREKRMVGFGLDAGPVSRINLYELNEAGQVVQQRQQWVSGFVFIHDFAITPNYCIFFQNPLFFNPLPFVFGFRGPAECIEFLKDQPTKVWVIPRDPSKAAHKFEVDSGFIFHHANAFEEGNEIVIDSIAYQDFPSVDHNLSYKHINFEKVPPGQLWRYRLNLETKAINRHLVEKRSLDFPFIHPDYITQPHHWIYLAAAQQPEGHAPQQTVLKINPETGEQQMWSAAPRGFVREPVFVPKPHSTQEDEGWVLVLVYNAETDRSYLAILDGQDISGEPIARLHLKHRIPYGLHGSFNATVF